MYRGLIQEAEDNFTFEGLCSFLVEGRYGSSFVPVVAASMHCSSILAGHVPGNQEVVVVGTVGIAPVGPVDSELAALGTDMVSSDTTLAGSDTGLVALGPEMSAHTGIGDSSLLSASAESRFVLCR